MRTIKTLGFKLLILSSMYKIFSIIYNDLFYSFKFLTYTNLLVTCGFFYLWYYWGYHNKLGIKDGLIVGIIGAADGIICSILSMKFIIESDASSLWFMYLWMSPVNFIMEYLSFSSISNFIPQLTVLVAILITSIGGYIGKKNLLSA